MTANQNDKQIIRELAKRYMELAGHPVMQERQKIWRDVKDLKMSRPPVLVEVDFIQDFVEPGSILCFDEQAQYVEKRLRKAIKHAEIGDDFIMAPSYKYYLDVEASDYGVDIERVHSTSSDGSNLGHAFKTPIETPDDFAKLKKRTFSFDVEKTNSEAEYLTELFGETMPLERAGKGSFLISLTRDLFCLLGAENFLVWLYEYPEEYKWLINYLCEDRLSLYEYNEKQGAISSGNIPLPIGSGSYGLVSQLPDGLGLKLSDVWVWAESQESEGISPEHFGEFFLPSIAKISNRFGLTYYGCCERLDDRWDYVVKAINNIRAVSISPWSNLDIMGEKLGKDYVFSRKPNPTYIAGNANWDMLKQDVQNTINAAKNCNFEIVFRDLYNKEISVERLAEWVKMVRGMM